MWVRDGARQGVEPAVLLRAFDAVKRRHEEADTASYNDDMTYKARLVQVRVG
jgi:hypothetical protein